MRSEPEAITAAADAARDAAGMENVGTYGQEGVVDHYEVTNWPEVAAAAVDAFLKNHPDLVADRLAREIGKRFWEKRALGQPNLHNIAREVLIEAFAAGLEPFSA